MEKVVQNNVDNSDVYFCLPCRGLMKQRLNGRNLKVKQQIQITAHNVQRQRVRLKETDVNVNIDLVRVETSLRSTLPKRQPVAAVDNDT